MFSYIVSSVLQEAPAHKQLLNDNRIGIEKYQCVFVGIKRFESWVSFPFLAMTAGEQVCTLIQASGTGHWQIGTRVLEYDVIKSLPVHTVSNPIPLPVDLVI
jgi:hypothetical protein